MRRALVSELGRMATVLRGIRPSAITVKGAQDYVTDIDHEVDRQLTHVLGELTSGVPVHSEERELTDLGDTYWLIDPIDGTSNFIHGLENVAICAALVQDGVSKIAAVCELYSGRVYSAERGKGAFENETQIQLSEPPADLIALSSGALDKMMGSDPVLYHELREMGRVRNLGSQALHICGVARGTFALAMSQEARLWDDLAGRLIAVEAGAIAYSAPLGTAPDAPQRSLFLHPKLADKAPSLCQAFWEEPNRGKAA